MNLRDATEADDAAVLAINQANVPAVSGLTPRELRDLAGMALCMRVAEGGEGGAVQGIIVCMGPGQPYNSPNYRWFSERYPDFVYVDRIAIAAAGQRKGIGSAFYREARALAERRGVPLLCEVNTRPRNKTSLAFHEAWGFEPVGEQDVEGGSKTVVMLALDTRKAA